MNQTDAIYDYMKQHGSIEPLQALRDLGVYRLAARIKNLRDKGYDIKTKTVISKSKITGRKIKFARYSISKMEGSDG